MTELNKLWKKTFKTIHQLSCFVGHPVPDLRKRTTYKAGFCYFLSHLISRPRYRIRYPLDHLMSGIMKALLISYWSNSILVVHVLGLSIIFKVVISVCLIVCPFITHEPLDRLASNFNWGTRENHENIFKIEWVPCYTVVSDNSNKMKTTFYCFNC